MGIVRAGLFTGWMSFSIKCPDSIDSVQAATAMDHCKPV